MQNIWKWIVVPCPIEAPRHRKATEANMSRNRQVNTMRRKKRWKASFTLELEFCIFLGNFSWW
ncbi:hypothetical protein RRSWK_05120 [Rhodopirellula sp. SWK7]|nr:hypothetical protein RRSWK_05120 [Rhodopirellula sp. SWK7]